MDSVTGTAAAVVEALATDMWTHTRTAIIRIWSRVLPAQAAQIDAELLSTRAEILVARGSGDSTTEQHLIDRWQARFTELAAADPDVTAELRLLAVPALTQTAVATNQSTIYQAQRDIEHIDNRSKYRIKIGRFNLGLGNLALLLAVLLGGTAGLVIWTASGPLDPVVGTWYYDAGTTNTKYNDGTGDKEVAFTMTLTLSITADGRWTMVSRISGRGSDGSSSDFEILCKGLVNPEGNRFEFQTMSKTETTWGAARNQWSECADRFTSTVGEDAKTLRMSTENRTIEVTRID